MAIETLDRRTALEEAFDSAEADEKGEEYVPPIHERSEPSHMEDETDVTEKDPAVVEAEATAEPKPKDRPRTRGVPLDERVKPGDAAKPEGEKTETPAKVTSALDKAPLGWGPQRDSLWAKTPTDVRAVIDRREREIQQGMSQAGMIRKIADEYHRVIQPFEPIIRSMNTTPSEAITNVMTTATALIVGTQEQKCAVLAEMVMRYNVDLPHLDKVLTGFLKGERKPQFDAPTPPLDPRLQPLFALEQRFRQAEIQKHERLQQEAAGAIESVQSEPFFEDVRDDMADIMEISAKRGHIMTIKEAYTKATQLHPEVSKLVAKNKPRTPSDALARARRAASTVRGSPGGAVTNGKADRRAALEEAWDSQR